MPGIVGLTLPADGGICGLWPGFVRSAGTAVVPTGASSESVGSYEPIEYATA
jgi:hypothetical protein